MTAIGDRRVADAIIAEVERRVMRRLGSMAFLDFRYGVVASVAGNKASVYLGSDTYASPGFIIPSGMTLAANDRVRVVIDPRGDRYVSEKF